MKFFIGFGKGLLFAGGLLALVTLFLMFIGFIAIYIGDGMSVFVGLVVLFAIISGLVLR